MGVKHPVVYEGEEVGTATVLEDGMYSISLHQGNLTATKLADVIQAGGSKGLSVELANQEIKNDD